MEPDKQDFCQSSSKVSQVDPTLTLTHSNYNLLRGVKARFIIHSFIIIYDLVIGSKDLQFFLDIKEENGKKVSGIQTVEVSYWTLPHWK